MLIKRFRLAWQFKVWPWQVPWQVVRWISLEPLTARDIQRTKELAALYGWDDASPSRAHQEPTEP